jgi:hypothetical protein
MTEPKEKNEIRPGEFWLTGGGDIVRIVRRHVIAIEDNWIANVAIKGGGYQQEAEVYGYDLERSISIAEAERILEKAQKLREDEARAKIAKFLK